jgi:hypothetical protein
VGQLVGGGAPGGLARGGEPVGAARVERDDPELAMPPPELPGGEAAEVGDAAPGRVAGVPLGQVRLERAGDRGAVPVGTDQGERTERLAVGEHADAVALATVAADRHADADAAGGDPRVQQLHEGAAADRHQGLTQRGREPVAVEAAQHPAGGVADGAGRDRGARAAYVVPDADRVERGQRVGPQRDRAAGAAELGPLVEQDAVAAVAAHCGGQRQAGDPRAGDHQRGTDRHEVSPPHASGR